MNTKQLPEAFVTQMRTTLGDEEAEKLFAALDEQPVVSIRLNTAKWSVPAQGDPVPWCSTGYYLPTRPLFTADPLFHAGAYYVQEASSMFIEQIILQHATLTPDAVALDLCAAPGGKSTLLRSLLPEGALLVCNEPMPKRAQVLAENMTKWGNPDVIVTQSLPSAFTPLTDTFDLILTDVPCSGEGMFRKDEVAIAEWSPDNVIMCQRRQRDILTDIWPALRPGGILIYSTCTFNRLENEDNVAWIANTLGADILPITYDSNWHITPTTTTLDTDTPPITHDSHQHTTPAATTLGYHFYPHRTRGEGVFCAALRKHSTPSATAPQHSNAPQALSPLAKLTTKSGDYALRTCHHPLLRQLQLTTRVLLSGIRLGEDTKKGFVPDTALALTTALTTLEHITIPTNKHALSPANRRATPHASTHNTQSDNTHALPSTLNNTTPTPYPRVALTLKDALAYLHGEALRLPPDTPHGYIIVTYQSLPLGFAKNIGSRANNLYPTPWRIKSSRMSI